MHFSSSYFFELIVVDRDLVGYTSFCRIQPVRIGISSKQMKKLID